MIIRNIPSTGESLPVLGLGTWQTFDVTDTHKRPLTSVLEVFHQQGGRLIDSSPMYGRAEETVGKLTASLPVQADFFYATKVWTTGRQAGIRQMESSFQKMQRTTMDLMQIHNLVDWQTHLETLQEWKKTGKIRYIGITHYTDSAHPELERVLATGAFDFVQFNYSLFNRHAEKRLLDAASAHGVATLINRPFGEGSIFSKVVGTSLPRWAEEYDIDSWPQLFLKYIISHPAVTCVIPATADIKHIVDNMKGAQGNIPDEKGRKIMADWAAGL